MTDFAKKMRCEAEDIASEMETESVRCRSVPDWSAKVTAWDGSERSNVKPFYSPYANFYPEACKVVFIGDNPGGDPKVSDTTTGEDYDAFLNEGVGGYSAFLHEGWGDNEIGQAPMQLAVQSVFRILFGEDRSREQLLHAASFNVCPLRTEFTCHIPCGVWARSEQWCNEILDHLEPDLIICCGYSDDYEGDLAKSPWAMLKRRRRSGFKELRKATWKIGKVRLKYGKLTTGCLADTSVIGLWHLSKPKPLQDTIKLLNRHRHELTLPESV